MLINDSQSWFYLDAAGRVIEGGPAAPPNAATLLVAPGGQLDDASAKKHGLLGTLKSSADVRLTNPVTGEPIELVDGKAYASHRVPGATPAVASAHPVVPAHPATPATTATQVASDQPISPAVAGGKHVQGPEGTKAVGGPADGAKSDNRR